MILLFFIERHNYSNKISSETEIVYKKNRHSIDPDYLRGLNEGYAIDHKFSRFIGYLEKIPPEVISCKGNLELLTFEENDSKHCKCSITKEELYELYEKEF